MSPEIGTNGIICAQCHPKSANTHPEPFPKFQKQLGRIALEPGRQGCWPTGGAGKLCQCLQRRYISGPGLLPGLASASSVVPSSMKAAHATGAGMNDAVSDLSIRSGRLLGRWVFASFWGLLLGVVLVVALASAWDLTGLGNTQFSVGLGVGAGIGFAQGRVARDWFGIALSRWIWTTALPLALPFVAADVAGALFDRSVYSLELSVAMGALLVGITQAIALRRHTAKAFWWIPACVGGWLLAVAGVGIPDLLALNARAPAPWDVLGTIFIWLAGGALLGLVGGLALVRMQPRNPASR